MVPRSRDEGIYYRREDYAGLWRRILVSAVDAVVVFAGLVALLLVGDAILSASGAALGFLIWLVLAYVYLVVCKRSRTRTLGYRLGRVKIVSIHGDSPRTGRVAFRLLFALIGGGFSSMLGLIDLFWITGDDHRQTLRDKLAHTYVIRTSAEPLGRGPIGYDVYHVMAWTLLVPGVRRRP
jgi:uncharacterized RDD family membrane protein YckC